MRCVHYEHWPLSVVCVYTLTGTTTVYNWRCTTQLARDWSAECDVTAVGPSHSGDTHSRWVDGLYSSEACMEVSVT